MGYKYQETLTRLNDGHDKKKYIDKFFHPVYNSLQSIYEVYSVKKFSFFNFLRILELDGSTEFDCLYIWPRGCYFRRHKMARDVKMLIQK